MEESPRRCGAKSAEQLGEFFFDIGMRAQCPADQHGADTDGLELFDVGPRLYSAFGNQLKAVGVGAVLIGRTLCAHPDIAAKFAELFG